MTPQDSLGSNRPGKYHYTRWLAHHHPEDCPQKCLVISGSYVCSRCAGLYPFVVVGLVVGLLWPVSAHTAALVYYMGASPAWIQWATEEMGLYPLTQRTKWIRFFTAWPAGWGLGLILSTHMREPWNSSFTHAMVITAVLSSAVLLISGILRWLAE